MKDLHTSPPITSSQEDDLLDALEVRCQTDVAAIRESSLQPVRIGVRVHAGNACDRQGVIADLVTSKLSTQSLIAISTRPLMVGSVFMLQFDRASLDVPLQLAVCDRCVMLNDNSFELRFRFARSVDLTDLRRDS